MAKEGRSRAVTSHFAGGFQLRVGVPPYSVCVWEDRDLMIRESRWKGRGWRRSHRDHCPGEPFLSEVIQCSV
jgi:hypothetical protein